MLYTASRACLQHPDVAAYKANRDLIYKQLQHAVSGISNAAQATATEDSALGQPGGAGELACALNSFDVSIQISMSISFLTVPPIEHIELNCHLLQGYCYVHLYLEKGSVPNSLTYKYS